ncbi:MAG TPA: SCO family protein [Lacipirellulaceae bacterium]|jgi:protein SCO1/2|nr:SCO family protein [Lacipirellulaceae bacterium]
MNATIRTRAAFAAMLIALGLSAHAAAAQKVDILHDVGIDQHLDTQIPLDLKFRDETGAPVKLGDYFTDQPVILVLAYYRCPMLCTQVLNGLVDSVRPIDFEMGKQFRVVTVSFDPREKSELAARKKETYATSYGRKGAAAGWHFLTGDEDSIAKLTQAVGFRYVYDEVHDQYAHASGIMVATSGGRLSHYFLGIDFPSRDVRLALVEASQGNIGSPVDRLLLLCYHYDPVTGKYTGATMTFVRIAGGITVLLIAVPIALAWRRDWRRAKSIAGVAG